MDDQQRESYLSSRDRHPPNEAAMFAESQVSLPDQPHPVFSERKAAFVSLEEARGQQHER